MTGPLIFVAVVVALSLVAAVVSPFPPPPIRAEAIYAEYVLNQMKREGLIK